MFGAAANRSSSRSQSEVVASIGRTCSSSPDGVSRPAIRRHAVTAHSGRRSTVRSHSGSDVDGNGANRIEGKREMTLASRPALPTASAAVRSVTRPSTAARSRPCCGERTKRRSRATEAPKPQASFTNEMFVRSINSASSLSDARQLGSLARSRSATTSTPTHAWTTESTWTTSTSSGAIIETARHHAAGPLRTRG